jgi:hypothetical protein
MFQSGFDAPDSGTVETRPAAITIWHPGPSSATVRCSRVATTLSSDDKLLDATTLLQGPFRIPVTKFGCCKALEIHLHHIWKSGIYFQLNLKYIKDAALQSRKALQN